MRKRLLVVLAAALVLLLGAGVAVGTALPDLRATGPASVSGTDGSAVFQIAQRSIRQVRYHDGDTLTYTFRLSNDSRLPVRVTGLAEQASDPRLFDYLRLVDQDGDAVFTVPGSGSVEVSLQLAMTGCETLSARAGSFVSEVALATTSPMGFGSRELTVPLPEEIRTGSPREAGCANATATSRPPG